MNSSVTDRNPFEVDNGIRNRQRTLAHRTGYIVWQHGLAYWHRSLSSAERRANQFWAKESAQIIDCLTGNRIWGKAQ